MCCIFKNSLRKCARKEKTRSFFVISIAFLIWHRYKRDDSSLEQGFFVRTASALIPIEVKAKNGTAKSMRTLISSEKYADIHCGIKFTGGNIGYSDDIYTFPYFCAFLLKRYLAGVNI